MSDSKLKRAGLDYWKEVKVREHPSWSAFSRTVPELSHKPPFFITKFGTTLLEDVAFFPCDRRDPTVLVFGSETKGVFALLGEEEIARLGGQTVKIFMDAPAGAGDGIRSHNLSSSVAMVHFEAHRQLQRLRKKNSSF